MKLAVFFSALLLSVSSVATANDLDQLMQGIRADIQAQRLGNPPGNNALEKIQAYRAQAPFDFRIVPLVYEWGEAYVALAEKALADGDVARAQTFLDRVWPVAALTPGLEALQARVDVEAAKAPVVAKAPSGPTAEERARQQRAAAEAAKERARLDAERQQRLAEARKQAEEEQRQTEAQRRRQQEEERLRRIAQQEAEAQRQAEAARVAQQASQQAPKAVVAPVSASNVVTASSATASTIVVDWDEVRETSEPIASYPISFVKLNNRDRGLTDDMINICRAIIDEDASVVIHTPDANDYRWLTVRLTLCLRRLDDSFRLRHSHQASNSGEAFLTLHPARSVSLLRQIDN
ncbi:MAG: hypothetical protein IBX52_04245 [Bacterioplanes sp.]|nr:hypothetical protein [Bacterioplanes sp.]